MKSVVGQYECVRRSGIGLDYFTSRVDRLTLQANGRFTLITQDRSRMVHAAQSLANGQQVSSVAPETRREGTYTYQGSIVFLHFDDGTQQQAQVTATDDGLQIGQDIFSKTSDSTLLPSPQRLKKDMEDIAKGLKIAGTIGGIAFKAAKTIHDTIQSTQEGQATQSTTPATPPVQPQHTIPSTAAPVQPVQPIQPAPAMPPVQQPVSSQSVSVETLYCDQCGTRVRPGKRFCNHCGARLP